jgi:hypothetical protein
MVYQWCCVGSVLLLRNLVVLALYAGVLVSALRGIFQVIDGDYTKGAKNVALGVFLTLTTLAFVKYAESAALKTRREVEAIEHEILKFDHDDSGAFERAHGLDEARKDFALDRKHFEYLDEVRKGRTGALSVP